MGATIKSIAAGLQSTGSTLNPVYEFFTEMRHLVSRPRLAYSKSIETRADQQYRSVTLCSAP
ncbi:hypothetical protein AGR7C_Lc10051 [Agrobacterium deltaense Zutra 3/1]|uniref:Uncharacterized protein n=1 Tax=Agrobacterium deltaense Zutra 3/1 TaxID=1183427 RepID=A0A1S7QP42_9HYPH|nr:hypothetical protein AGR7C_Lc10051 [Agrobacterium deltaense Zutra 3/1]